jgi:CubicO group peptidase (beta-lactamase class C family)
MKSRFALETAVLDAWKRTGVPGVAAALRAGAETTFAAAGVRSLETEEPVALDTPFRIASVTKPFTATLAEECIPLDARVRALLSHTAGLRCEAPEPLPPAAEGLWSYSNAGYWQVGTACAAAGGSSFEDAMRAHVLEPLELRSTSFDEPVAPARGHVQEGESGHRTVPVDVYPVWRRASGGLWSTVGDLVRFGTHHLDGARAALHEPHAEALGGRYALGWWVRELADGGTAWDHEGSTAGYQSLLLVVPDQALVLAVLTNSWRGSGLIRRVVESLGLLPQPLGAPHPLDHVAGAYALDNAEAVVEESADGLLVSEIEIDPVTGAMAATRYPARPLGENVYGFARGVLMSHRLDFPRDGVARIGWVALPRTAP